MVLGALPHFITNPDPTIYLHGKYVVLDFETTNTAVGFAGLPANSIVCAAWKCSWKDKVQFADANEIQLGNTSLPDDLAKADFIVCQNCKFEIQWMTRIGLKIEQYLYYDTMLGRAVELGNQPKHGKCNLDALATHYKVPMQKDVFAKRLIGSLCPSKWPREWRKEYNIADVITEELVFLRQRELLHAQGLLPTFYHKCLFTPVIAEMELRGLYVDAEILAALNLQYTHRLRILQQTLEEVAQGVLVTSPDQVRKFLYNELKLEPIKDYKGKVIRTQASKKHPLGQLPTNEDTILQLKPVCDRSKVFLEAYKEAKGIKSTFSKFITPLSHVVMDQDSIVYFQLNQTIAATWRLSSTKREGVHSIQGQNIPREFKSVFRARHAGWLFSEVDEAGFEFRIGVDLTRDKQGQKDIADPNFDIHVFSANSVFDLGLTSFEKKQISSELRTDSKKHSFGPMYGKSSGSEREKAYQQAWKLRYKDLYATQESWCWEVLANKQITLPTGMKFYWPKVELKQTSYGAYIKPKTEIYNQPIQYFATGEGTPIAAVCQWHRMKSLDMKSFLVLTVHDSTEAEVHPEEREVFSALSLHAFSRDVPEVLKKLYNYDMVVPLEGEIGFNTWWGGKQCKSCGTQYSPLTPHICTQETE